MRDGRSGPLPHSSDTALSSRSHSYCERMATSHEYVPTPTEVIASWIPHDARWNKQARAAARGGVTDLRRYVTGLVSDHCDGTDELTDEFDRRTIDAIVEDVRLGGGLGRVRWDSVQDAMLIPERSGLWKEPSPLARTP